MEKNTKMKRKVLFKKFIPLEYLESDSGFQQRIEGTGKMELEFNNPGTFHQFGMSMEEDESGFTNYTIAIIEDESGNLHEVLPSNMKFVDVVKIEGLEYSEDATNSRIEWLKSKRNRVLDVDGLSEVVRYILNKI